MREEVRCTCK